MDYLEYCLCCVSYLYLLCLFCLALIYRQIGGEKALGFSLIHCFHIIISSQWGGTNKIKTAKSSSSSSFNKAGSYSWEAALRRWIKSNLCFQWSCHYKIIMTHQRQLLRYAICRTDIGSDSQKELEVAERRLLRVASELHDHVY